MPSASISKEISCSKDNLIKMVLDVEKYPEFVPWCLNGKIHEKKYNENKIEIIADLTKEFDLGRPSIGMSADYLYALEFDPKYIRLGTVLFGKRL